MLLLQCLKKLRKYVRARPYAPCRLLPFNVFFFLCKKEESEFEIYCTLRARSWAWIHLDLLGEFWGEPGPKQWKLLVIVFYNQLLSNGFVLIWNIFSQIFRKLDYVFISWVKSVSFGHYKKYFIITQHLKKLVAEVNN